MRAGGKGFRWRARILLMQNHTNTLERLVSHLYAPSFPIFLPARRCCTCVVQFIHMSCKALLFQASLVMLGRRLMHPKMFTFHRPKITHYLAFIDSRGVDRAHALLGANQGCASKRAAGKSVHHWCCWSRFYCWSYCGKLSFRVEKVGNCSGFRWMSTDVTRASEFPA